MDLSGRVLGGRSIAYKTSFRAWRSGAPAAAPISPAASSRCSRSRALVRDPKIILLDEPFEGLAPLIVKELMKVCRALVAAGLTIVLVEQNLAPRGRWRSASTSSITATSCTRAGRGDQGPAQDPAALSGVV